ncbi:MAG: putative 7-carboxy-7-deazaguanine synthase QueE [Oscillospiraceae bacterium]|jgi:7-carboxy-7-deazaguanine synthase|nr:putative 7-carboxy-7-deazaguanine synthase QueE [Oscillospiraceae bacterium]
MTERFDVRHIRNILPSGLLRKFIRPKHQWRRRGRAFSIFDTAAVAEKFISINGEGEKSGELAVFIRFCGCNLNCSYCDTAWANKKNLCTETLSARNILSYVNKTGIKNVTLTGGEPLLQQGIAEILNLLCYYSKRPLYIEIETNGSVDISGFSHYPVHFTMDYKLPSSGMELSMLTGNFMFLLPDDTVKFVIGTKNDMERALEVIYEFSLLKSVNIHFSPVFGKIEISEIVEFMKEHKLNDVKLSLQLHKFIWDKDTRGV